MFGVLHSHLTYFDHFLLYSLILLSLEFNIFFIYFYNTCGKICNSI